MAAATYPVTNIVRDGPRDRSYTYIMAAPAGTAGISDACFFGPVETLPEPGNCLGLHVSFNPSTPGANTHALTVYGTFDSATVTPSGRNWWVARGDMPPSVAGGGVNVHLSAVTMGGMFKVYGPARSYRFRVTGPTGLTAGLTVYAMIITSPRG